MRGMTKLNFAFHLGLNNLDTEWNVGINFKPIKVGM